MRPLLPLLVLAACGTPPKDTDPGDAADTGAGDTADTADTGEATVDFCAEQGLTSRAWDPEGTTADYDRVAPDLTIETIDGGSLVLSEAATGCDVVVFVVYDPETPWPVDLSRPRDVDDWLLATPANARFVFLSGTVGAVDEDMEALRQTIDNGIDQLDDAALAEHWRGRIHYASTLASNTGWIGDLHGAYHSTSWPFSSFAIDRYQFIRETGYFADPATGFQDNPPTALAWEAQRFNAEAARQERLEAVEADVVRVWDAEVASDPYWAGESLYGELALPADMSGYDTLELDLTLGCGGHPEVNACPAWDYIVSLYLCDVDDTATEDDESATCDVEIGRWITTYARAGRWVHDVTPFLAQLQDGGARRLRFYTQQEYDVTLDVRLSNQGRGARPVAMEYLWSGGGFDEAYNDGREPYAFAPPTDAARVEIAAVTTGHGYAQDTENCAEFCNHQHVFTVNGADAWTQEFPMAGTAYGCAEQIGEQTVPNQYGTWVYGRGGWCPGKQVDVWTADITGSVALGGENTLEYAGLFEGETFVPVATGSSEGFGANINLASWVVYYEQAGRR